MSTVRVTAQATVVVPDGTTPTTDQLLAAVAAGGTVTGVILVEDQAIKDLQNQVTIEVSNAVFVPVELPLGRPILG